MEDRWETAITFDTFWQIYLSNIDRSIMYARDEIVQNNYYLPFNYVQAHFADTVEGKRYLKRYNELTAGRWADHQNAQFIATIELMSYMEQVIDKELSL